MFASDYRVAVLPVGGRVNSASSGDTVTLDSGHGFQVGDKFMVDVDLGTYIGTDSVQSVTATSVTISGTVSVAAGQFLVNLGPDTGSDTPNYDGDRVQIYDDMDYGDEIVGATVSTDSVGRYRYFHKGVSRWELVLALETPIALYLDTGHTDSTSHASTFPTTSGSGTESDPFVGWEGAVAADTKTVFAPGFYGLDEDLTIPEGATLEGSGPSSVILFTAQNVAIVNDTDAGNITVRNLKVDAQGDTFAATPRNAFEFTQGQGQNYLFENLHVTDATKAGIRMEGESGVNTNCTVRGCTVTSCDRHGIEFSTSTTHSQAVDNYLYNNSVTTLGAQIYLSDTDVDYCTVRGNNVIDGNDNGIRILGNFCVVSDNVIQNGANDGIRLNGTYHSCTGNVINNVAESGIKWDGLTDSSITGNTIESAGIHGIHGRCQTASGRNNISGNTVRHSAIDGLRFSNSGADESDSLVSNNVFQNNTTSGIDLGAGVRIVVTSNLFRGNGTSITDAGTGNMCFNNINGSVGLYGTDIDSAATITLPPDGDVFEVNGTTTITSVTASWTGRVVTLVFTGALTFTDGSNLKLAGNLSTAASDTITLRCDGTNWNEVGRGDNS